MYSVSSTDDGAPQVKIQTETGYYHSQGTAVINPLLQSIISGALLAIATVAICLYFGWPRAWETGGLVLAISQCFIWGVSIFRWNIWVDRLEALLGLDLNRNNVIGPAPEPETVRIELVEDGGRHVTYIDFPATESQRKELANGLLKGLKMTEKDWTGRNRPFSKREFHELRRVMIARGLLVWVNNKFHWQGLMLTKPGEAVMRHFAGVREEPPSPTPGALARAK